MNILDQLRKTCSPDVVALNPELFEPAAAPQTRRNKYNARKLTVEGVSFDSKKEYLRWVELSAMQEAGLISNLQRQVRFVLQEAFVDGAGKRCRAITYTADHTYQDGERLVIEDVKSVITARSESFRVRWRMLLNQFKDDKNTVCLIHT